MPVAHATAVCGAHSLLPTLAENRPSAHTLHVASSTVGEPTLRPLPVPHDATECGRHGSLSFVVALNDLFAQAVHCESSTLGVPSTYSAPAEHDEMLLIWQGDASLEDEYRPGAQTAQEVSAGLPVNAQPKGQVQTNILRPV